MIFFVARCSSAFAVPFGCWKVSAREFTFQFVAVTLGFAFSMLIFSVTRGGAVRLRQRLRDFFLARCARGDCKLLEIVTCGKGERKREREGEGQGKGKGKGRAKSLCVFFSVACCARGVCKLLEIELARIYVRACGRYIGKREREKEWKRDGEKERGKGKERGKEREREKERDRDREREKEREREREKQKDREREREKARGRGKGRESSITCRGRLGFVTYPCNHLLTCHKLTCRGQLAWATCTC